MMASVPNPPGHRAPHDGSHAKDGLGGLVGAGPSKVGVDGAMRARDVARPTAEDLADAERDLVIRHAAARVENRPLPHGIAPASPVAEPAEEPGRRKNARPTPHPPSRRAGDAVQRRASDHPPSEAGGSTPERS
jgi:hypothetical protein